jgi:uncharacterized membrane protein YdjX (TVP38/TMEM64 family)
VLLPLIGFPVSLLWGAAGALYGPGMGLAIAATGLAGNLHLGYLIGDRIGRSRYAGRFWERVPRARELVDSNQIDLAIALRSLPGIPLFLQNYVLGATGMPYRAYMITSFVMQSVYMVLFVLLGVALAELNWQMAALLVVALVAAAVILRKVLSGPSKRQVEP